MSRPSGDGSGYPLGNVRILDCTHSWAGPLATQMLAFFGAQVIHIEAPHRPDRWRGPVDPAADDRFTYRYPGASPGERPFDRNALFNEKNTNKLGLTLNLLHPKGREIFGALVRISDAVVTNFSAPAIRKLHLDHDSLAEVNPEIVTLSLTGMGETGPERDYVAWGVTIEALSGLSSMKGYKDGPPLLSNMAYGDPVGGIFGAVALITAIWESRKTGRGQHIDLSLLECSTTLLLDMIADHSLSGSIPKRKGNRHESYAPRGCYRCRGEDKWLAIAVTSDAEWRALQLAMGEPQWAKSERFSTSVGRVKYQDEIDKNLEEWTCDFEPDELMKALQDAGVPAGSVLSNRELLDNEQLSSRRFFTLLRHPQAGENPYPRMPILLSRTPGGLRSPAPMFGEHNRWIVCDLLGYSEQEYASLVEEQVIGSRPLQKE